MTEKISQKTRIVMGAGGVAALVMVVLGILSKPAYASVVKAAVMWSSAGLSMIVLGIAFIHIRNLLKTPAAYLVAAVLFVQAVLVVVPLFIVYEEAADFMNALQCFRNGVDVLFLVLMAWVVYCGQPVLGGILSRFIAAALTLAALGLLANHIVPWLSGTFSVFLSWMIVLSTLLGIAGLGAGFIWLAVKGIPGRICPG